MTYPELNELIQANQLMEEGNIKKAYQVVIELEQRADLSYQEPFLHLIKSPNWV